MDLSWRDGDLISREAVLRGNLLDARILSRDQRPRGGPRSASASCPGCSWARRGRADPGTCPRRGRRALRPPGPADMLPLSEEVRGGGGLRGQNGLCSLGLEEQRRAPRVLGEATERVEKPRHSSSGRPWSWRGKLPTWEMTRGGEEAAFQGSVWPSRTTGVLLGSPEKRNPYL